MKQKRIPSSENIENRSPQKLPQNNAPIIHAPLGCQTHDVTADLHCPELQGLQCLGATGDGSAKDLFEGQNPNITKREMDFHYGGDTEVVCTPPANFFSELSLHENCSGKCLEMARNEMVDGVTKGSSVYNSQSSNQAATTNKEPNGCIDEGAMRDHPLISNLVPLPGGVGVGNDDQVGVAAHVCHETRSEKRKRCTDEVSTRCRKDISSDDGVRIVGQPSDSHTSQNVAQPPKRNRHTGQASTSCVDHRSANISEASPSYAFSVTEPSSSHVIENATQPRKRSRRAGQASTGRANNITEPSTSYAAPVTKTASSHVTQNATQPRKRSRRAGQVSTGRPNNITEASTSYAALVTETASSHVTQNTSPAYDDLGDCTECCNYCNAAFWRGERLADIPPLDPEVFQGLIHFLDAHNDLVQIFRTARDKCSQADVPEFKVRLYSGEGPRGYELPSSNTLGEIVFDRGPESESNYDVVLEYRDGLVKRISKIHKSYMSLQFPLIFIYATPPGALTLIHEEALKKTKQENTSQETNTKTVKRALFEEQPSQSKQQKGHTTITTIFEYNILQTHLRQAQSHLY
ncbi:helitron helicase-like domain-containing protein [Artemisia annua]|uniref:Helitron helicase-like domain-containing protein n=1 Tax=Artemisia annua TaxID=35608 RepID=A0A2U1KUH2_ARTAN|nr:helitron helicase-like domain-containing protein [Artemisia annua]